MKHDIEERKALLMGFMDKELSPEEMTDINELLMRDAAFREEYEALCRVCNKLDRLHFDAPDEAILKRLWKSPYSRFANSFAWVLIAVGVCVFTSIAIYGFFASGSEAWYVKIPIVAIVSGLLILLIQKIRDRVISYESDPYKEIEK